MKTRRPMWLRSIVAILLSLGLLGTACATQDEGEQEATEESNGPETGVDTAASQLRSGLTSQLQEHVYLAGIAVDTGASAGLDSAEFEAAAGALDENSVALSESITSVYGEAAGQQFLELWRKHIGFFVDYTEGKATGDNAKVEEARKNLDEYREDFGAFLESANPNLPKEAVIEELQPHVKTMFAAIDAVVAGEASAFSKLREAAQVMPNTAKTLAGAIAAQMPDEYPGNVDGDAAGLRADLTHLLQEHVYLAGIAVDTGASAGLDSAEFEAAAGALDENSVALSESITSVYGEAAGQQFLELWRKHIGFFVDYTEGKATDDARKVREAERKLDEYREDFGAFLESANPNLPKEAVIEELQPHVKTLSAAIDAVVAGEASAFSKLREAAQVMPNTAKTLSGAIAEQQDLK